MKINRKAVVRYLALIFGTMTLIPVVALGALAISARSSDGPSVIFRGGVLESGELVTDWESDWSFARDIRTFELQLLNPPQSRTLWIVEVDGKLYLNSNYMLGFVGRLWKRWPAQAERDGRAILRIEGKRYERTLVRIQRGAIVDDIAAEFNRKYRAGMTREEVESGKLWLFELAPPNANMTGGAG